MAAPPRPAIPPKPEIPPKPANAPRPATPPSPNIAPPKVPPHVFEVPEGLFSSLTKEQKKLARKYKKGATAFNNARPAAMLARGWRVMNDDEFNKPENNTLVLMSHYDGPEYEANLVSFQADNDDSLMDIFTFQSLDSTHTWTYTRDELANDLMSLYVKTEPVPFTYTIDKARAKAKRKTRRQRGGFYPSVYGGIAGAKMLTPLIARQMMRMYESNARKTRKHKSKKLSRNKRG